MPCRALPCYVSHIALLCRALSYTWPCPCHAMPCLALPCRALSVPCLAMPCLALPCHALSRYAMPCPCHAMPCHALPCPAVLCLALPRRALSLPCPCHAKPCHATPGLIFALPCHAVPCLAMPCRALPCRAMRCLAILAVPCRAGPCRAVPCLAHGLAMPCPLLHIAVPCHFLLVCFLYAVKQVREELVRLATGKFIRPYLHMTIEATYVQLKLTVDAVKNSDGIVPLKLLLPGVRATSPISPLLLSDTHMKTMTLCLFRSTNYQTAVRSQRWSHTWLPSLCLPTWRASRRYL